MQPFYQTELKDIRQMLVLMGEKSIEIVRLAIEGFIDENVDIADRVLTMDDEIDSLEVKIDANSVRYISLRSPVASDVRLLTVAMKACHDLERVGDEASSIAKRTKRIAQLMPPRHVVGIPKMAEVVMRQLQDAIDSFITQNVENAYAVPQQDRIVDEINRENYKLLTEQATENPAFLQQAIELIFISKSLERIGDHATNIAEEVIFYVEGDDIRHTAATQRKLD